MHGSLMGPLYDALGKGRKARVAEAHRVGGGARDEAGGWT